MRNILIVVLLAASAAQAQTNINIDFGNLGGSPPASYAGAGSGGIWNVVAALGAAPTGGFVDINGNPTGLIITSSQELFDVRANHGLPSIPQPDNSLLSDYLCGTSGRLTLTFSGLSPGNFKVITYVTVDTTPVDAVPTTVTPFGNPALAAEIEGWWEEGLAEGMTHSVHELLLPSGSFTLQLSVDDDACANGIQLIALPEPALASVLSAGMLVVCRWRGRRKR